MNGMTDTTELAQSLKAAAEKASSGDWVKESGDGWDAIYSNDDQANGGFIIANFIGPDSAANREFVQLANPVNVHTLVEALEKAQQRIVELDSKNSELDSLTQRWAVERAENAERIADLESRTVKLPKPLGWKPPSGRDVVRLDDVKKILTAAGIKVEAE